MFLRERETARNKPKGGREKQETGKLDQLVIKKNCTQVVLFDSNVSVVITSAALLPTTEFFSGVGGRGGEERDPERTTDKCLFRSE